VTATPRSITDITVYNGTTTSTQIDPLDQTKRPKKFNNACPNGRCPHAAWLHRTGILAPLFEAEDDSMCGACYDCSTEEALDDDTDA
jgi:hypothetical protein